MAIPGIEQMIIVLLLLGGGGDAIDYLDRSMFWEAVGIEVSAETMRQTALGESVPRKDPAANIVEAKKWLDQLGAMDSVTRKQAREALLAMGADALPALKAYPAGDDPEISSAIDLLIAAIPEPESVPAASTRLPEPTTELRQLMAIRELALIGDESDVATLESLTSSDVPFVAEYANDAILAIRKQPRNERPRVGAVLDQTLTHLPAGGDLVLRAETVHGANWEQVLGLFAMMGVPPTLDAVLKRATPKWLTVLNRIGNFRYEGLALKVDSATRGISMLLHGRYDVDKLFAVASESDPGVSRTDIDGYPALVTEQLVMASIDETMLLIALSETGFPTETVLAAIKKGGAGTTGSDALSTLAASTSRSGPVWAAMLVQGELKAEVSELAMFEHAKLSSSQKGEKVALRFEGKGSDPDAIATMAAGLQLQVDNMVMMLQQQASMMPVMAAMGSMLETFTMGVVDDTVTITMDTEPGFFALPLIMTGAVFRMAPAFQRIQDNASGDNDTPAVQRNEDATRAPAGADALPAEQ